MQRLILQSVDVTEQADGREAVVVLHAGENKYIGRCRPDNNDEMVAVAQATLDALKQYLPIPIELQLTNAAAMQHESIGANLLVVTVDYLNNGERTSLTGTCLSNEEGVVNNIAKATLDATNRLITFLLEKEQLS